MMKKTILLLFSVLAVSYSFAQKGKVTTATTLLDAGDVVKAKEAIDAAITNEKSKDWPKTYIVAAKVYTQLYKKGKDELGAIKASEFYNKAIELDKKGDAEGKKAGKFKQEIGQALLFFGNELTNAGVEAFNKNDYKSAVAAFENLLKLNNNEYAVAIQGEKVDSVIIYNTALAAYNGQMWPEAIKYFNQAIDIKYGGGDAVLLLHQVFVNSGDSLKMGDNLIKGFETYPTDDRIITELINYYLTSNQNDKALGYLNKAIEKDQSNPSFFFARGALNDNSGSFEAALEDYKKCLEIDPQYYRALYNLGVIYFNKGVEQMNEANAETETKKYNAKKAVAEETFKVSLPYFEKALEVEPNDAGVMESLKTLYYRFGMNDKYNEIDARLKSL